MKAFIIFFTSVQIFVADNYAQSCNATGASINSSLQVVKNIKTDFGAMGDGITNDQQAFNNAANFINNNVVNGITGNVKLIIPGGIYLVGEQEAHLNNTATHAHPVYEGKHVMYLHDVNNVTIQGSIHSMIIFKNGMKFGTFDLSNGLPPITLDEFNPSTNGNVQDPYYYFSPHKGTIGNFLFINTTNYGDENSNIEIKDLEINGNSDNYILGGNWGFGARPIEVSNAFGLYLINISGLTISNVKIHHCGQDNLYIGSYVGPVNSPNPPNDLASSTNNVLIQNIICEFAGRNNFSWASGENFCVSGSSFNHAANKNIKTSPGYGMDIEPEGESPHPLCRNGFFDNCVFGFNGGLGLTNARSRDNTAGLPVGDVRGYSYNHYFFNCSLIGNKDASARIYSNRVTFDNCNFYGEVVNYASTINSGIQEPAVFKNSLFSDCYNGKTMFTPTALLALEYSYQVKIVDNNFKRFSYNSTFPYYSRLIYGPINGHQTCSDPNLKPIFQDNNFYFLPNPTQEALLSQPHHDKFINNNFYKQNSSLTIWSNTLGCQLRDNEEPWAGSPHFTPGFIYHDLNLGDYGICQDKLICEKNIYSSEEINESNIFQSAGFIYTDSKIQLSTNESVKYESAESIILNPNFETNLLNNAYIDLSITPCTHPSGRTMAANILTIQTPLNNEYLLSTNNSLVVFPNPSSNDFLVQFNAPVKNQILYYITNSLGKIIESGSIRPTGIKQNSFNIKNITIPGIYFLKININERSESRKLIRL